MIQDVQNADLHYPDWGSITLGNLPVLQESGAYVAATETVQQMDFDPSLSWNAGQHITELMTLGDFSESLQLQALSLEQIAEMANLSLSELTLDDFPLLGKQTIRDLVTANPALSNLSVDQVPAIADLVSNITSINQPIGELLNNPSISELPLNRLDLSQYPLTSIPGISESLLSEFDQWDSMLIDEIPGLSDVAFSSFPGFSGLQGIPAIVNIVLGEAEEERKNTVSGGYYEGFDIPCTKKCAHIELGLPLEGKQWISGMSQDFTMGGSGFLTGLEPIGVHPFGKAFKLVILEVNEDEGIAIIGAFFRICTQYGCTPYIIGPVPMLPAWEGGFTFVGPVSGSALLTDLVSNQVSDPLPETFSGKANTKLGETSAASAFPRSRTGSSLNTDSPLQSLSSPIENFSILRSFSTGEQDITTKVIRPNPGIDLKADKGSLVKAATAGVVTHAQLDGTQTSGYGNKVIIEHSDSFKTSYSNLQDYSVKAGDVVVQGQAIGHLGNTGYATAPQLHFEVFKDGLLRDPIDYLNLSNSLSEGANDDS
ncbi:MAG: M23 family metallopeptidase [Cyanobacteria bacterium J06634_5]